MKRLRLLLRYPKAGNLRWKSSLVPDSSVPATLVVSHAEGKPGLGTNSRPTLVTSSLPDPDESEYRRWPSDSHEPIP